MSVSPSTQLKALVLSAAFVISLLAVAGCKPGQEPDSPDVGDKPWVGETERPVSPEKPGKTAIPPGSHTLERFDLRDYADLTPVKAQGETGGCWAFASIAALESHLAYVEGTVTDLSENNLMTQVSRVYDESYDRDPDSGGDDAMATGYYVSWRGPVRETDDPFPASAKDEDMVVRPSKKPVRYVQEVLFLPERESPLDNEEIKRAITEFGGIAAAMWKGSPSTFGPYYNEDAFAWYYDKPAMNEEGNGHAVTIVGWDDAFPKENFKITPPGDGAFIVRNTKGPNWGSTQGKEGMGGYFYVSYYDPMFMTKLDSLIGNHVFAKVSESRPYDRIYQHDLLGYNYRLDVPASLATDGGFTVSFASAFKATCPYGELLKAVGFYTLEKDVQYEVFVARGFAQESLVDTVPVANGVLRLPGFHTVDFGTPVSVGPQSRFVVVVKLTGADKPGVAADSADGKFVKKSVSSPGESYIKWGLQWTDLYDILPDTNVCLKAFSDDGEDPADPADPNMMKVADMKKELEFVIDRLKTYHPVARESGFTEEQSAVIESARAKMAAPMSKENYYFEMQRVFAAMGDGHTTLHNPFKESMYLDLPLEWLIEDGIVVTADAGPLKKGDQVKSIGGCTDEALLTMLGKIVSHENDYWLFHGAPDYLTRASYLTYFGLVNEDRTADVEVLRNGATTVHRLPLTPSRTMTRPRFVEAEWWVDRDYDLGYFRFDEFLGQDEMGPLADEIDKFFDSVKTEGVGNIAFDWRYNEGGVAAALNLILTYLPTGPVYAEGNEPYPAGAKKPDDELFTGQVYVLTGKRTFSCAVFAATILHDNGIAITLGEPTGENPAFNRNSADAAGELPVTGWHFMMTGYKPSRPNFLDASDEALFPDIPAHTSREDLVAGRDAQVEALLEVTAPGSQWVPKEDPGPTPGQGPKVATASSIEEVSYSSKWGYFVIVFKEPVKSLDVKGITITTGAGESIPVERADIGAGDPTNVVITPKNSVTKDDQCTIHLGANAFVLSSGATNEEPVELRNYQYD